MLVPLPNLDDRRWEDLVEESQALIPLYAPSWTDHNVHDPGITLIELFAWQTEMDIFQVNQVSDAHRLGFLALAGIRPEPPKPVRSIVRVALVSGAARFDLPNGIEFSGIDPFGVATTFQTLRDLTVVPGELVQIVVVDSQSIRDLSRNIGRSEAAYPFGEDPMPGAALYLGFSEPLPPCSWVSLYVSLAGAHSEYQERTRILSEREASRHCGPERPRCPDCDATSEMATHDVVEPLSHHSVRTTWEFFTTDGVWRALDVEQGELDDDTRQLSLSGAVRVCLPEPMAPGGAEGIDATRFFLRCRFVAGSYDAAPRLAGITVNAVEVEQVADPVGDRSMVISGRLRRVETLGVGDGLPWQRVVTSRQPVVADRFGLWTIEDDELREWTRQYDFDASKRSDAHFLLDPTTGLVTFGDGEHGRTVPQGSPILALYVSTRAEAGNLGIDTIRTLADNAHNRMLLPALDGVLAAIQTVSNPVAACGGAAAESAVHAEGRAVASVERALRAVTLADIEQLALETPGVRLARATARADVHPAFPCFSAPGMISLMIMPWLPTERPAPSAGLMRTVSNWIGRRRPIGTRIEVFGPTYRSVVVHATVQAEPGIRPATLQPRVVAALDRFFHPINGGPDGTGWPFGRDVHRSEVLQTISNVDGVEHVIELELIADGCGPQCGSVCLGLTELVDSGCHQIIVK